MVLRKLTGPLMPKRSSQTHIGRIGGGVMCIARGVHWICYVAQQGALGGLTGVGLRQGLHKRSLEGFAPCQLKWGVTGWHPRLLQVHTGK